MLAKPVIDWNLKARHVHKPTVSTTLLTTLYGKTKALKADQVPDPPSRPKSAPYLSQHLGSKGGHIDTDAQWQSPPVLIPGQPLIANLLTDDVDRGQPTLF